MNNNFKINHDLFQIITFKKGFHPLTLDSDLKLRGTCFQCVFKGGESSSQFQWFTIAKTELENDFQ